MLCGCVPRPGDAGWEPWLQADAHVELFSLQGRQTVQETPSPQTSLQLPLINVKVPTSLTTM